MLMIQQHAEKLEEQMLQGLPQHMAIFIHQQLVALETQSMLLASDQHQRRITVSAGSGLGYEWLAAPKTCFKWWHNDPNNNTQAIHVMRLCEGWRTTSATGHLPDIENMLSCSAH